ncbi:MAG TPA: hypothetical protein VJQ82_27680 [Terriglobales bacterium]|nr:hypothetical protein [Terriglobales bacterium]
MAEQTVDAVCEKCGQTFKTFLEQMADKNLRVICPRCAAEQQCPSPAPDKMTA